jgi:hypothetical protein
MWVTGRVRDRGTRPRSGDGGHDFFGLARKNGGAPSSLTRPQSPHHDRTSARETSPTPPPRRTISAETDFLQRGRLTLSAAEGTHGQ